MPLLAGLLALQVASPPAEAAADGCALCGIPIGKGPSLVDRYGNRRHIDHGRDAWGAPVPEDAWPCHVCGRPIDTRQRKTACQACRATAVDAPAEVAPSAQRIVAWMARQGLRFHGGPPPISLRVPDDGDPEDPLYGNDGVALLEEGDVGLPCVSDVTRRASVQVRAGMPRLRFESVLAHEIFHAWSWLDHQPRHRGALREGAASFNGYRWLLTIGTPEARFLARSYAREQSYAYGTGLRGVQAFVAQKGVPGLVKLMRTGRDLPADARPGP